MSEALPIEIADPLPVARDHSISPLTVAQYLFGSATAIRTLAANRNTIWLGLLFVVSAGFAREYDGEDLIREPWHLLLPVIASLTTSFLLFCLVWMLSVRRGPESKPLFARYRSFLGLYWMTAPLAWIYAIPVERISSAPQSVLMNLWFLAIVSVWRVVLIIRVISVLYGFSVRTVLPLVLLFADTIALTLLAYLPKPVFALMGGVRITESEAKIVEAQLILLVVGGLTWPVWFFSTAFVFATNSPKCGSATDTTDTSSVIAKSVWGLAIFSIVGWAFVLPFTQREQQLRSQTQSLLRAGNLQEAVDLMSMHRPDEFPPHWDPLPDSWFHDRSFEIAELLGLVADRPNDWFRPVIIDKFRRQFRGFHLSFDQLGRLPDAKRLRVLEILEGFPDRDLFLEDDWNAGVVRTIGNLATATESDAESVGLEPISDEVRTKAECLFREFQASHEKHAK